MTIAALLLSIMAGCAALDKLAAVGNLLNCEYALRDVSQVSIAGVNVKALSQGQISAADVVKLAAALQSKSVPLTMNVNVGITNPTANKAAVTDMDWILNINGTQFAQGTSTGNYTIAAHNTAVVPLPVTTDLFSLFSRGGIESLKSFVQSFNSDGTSSNVAIKIRPSLNMGNGNKIQMPDYITLNKKVGGTNTNNNNNNNGTGTVSTGGVTIKR